MPEIRTFRELFERVQQKQTKSRIALVCAQDIHSLEAAAKAVSAGVMTPVLVGDRTLVRRAAESIGFDVPDSCIVHTETPVAAAAAAVQLVREGRADGLMKGGLETADFLHPVVNKETGLSLGKTMSHISINEVPTYHKLLVSTDGGMLPYPTLMQKKDIIENAVSLLLRLGYECPKVCVLTAAERINPKMPESVEAATLKELNCSGAIQNCIVEGPISLDLALVKERSAVKHYESPCAGDADILVVPNIHAGNILGKSMVELANAKMAGVVMGAMCPIVLTSRGSSAEEKYNSLLLACAAAGQNKEK